MSAFVRLGPGIHYPVSTVSKATARTTAPTRTGVRSAAVADLFGALEDLMIHYGTLPEDERAARWSADADRITGEIARHLHSARRRISAVHPGPYASG
jgi:hypothetical protein